MKIFARMAIVTLAFAGFSATAAQPSARAKLRAISKDPDSLQFRNERVSKADPTITCGEMNGKNGFGGYVGFRRFIVSSGTILTDDGQNPRFNEAWARFCVE
jgi:hypothetical protein